MKITFKGCYVRLENIGSQAYGGTSHSIGVENSGLAASIQTSGRKIRKCDYCTYETDRKSNMESHLVRIHREETGLTLPFACSACDEQYCSKQDLSRHQKKTHGVLEPVPLIVRQDEAGIKLFENKVRCIDWIMAISLETYFWVLPSNRFTDGPDPNFSQRLLASEILRNQDLSVKEVAKRLQDELVPTKFEAALSKENVRYKCSLYSSSFIR